MVLYQEVKQPGRKTRFKKINNTLENETLNGANLPNRLDPIQTLILKNDYDLL